MQPAMYRAHRMPRATGRRSGRSSSDARVVRLVAALLIAGSLAPASAHAQADTTRVAQTQPGYSRPAWGGPSSPAATLKKDDEDKQAWRLPTPISDDIRNWKRGINEKIGLEFGINYQAVFLTASSGITDESQTSSAGGVLGLPVKWTLLGRGTGWAGTFTILIENRHVYGNYVTPPQNLAFEVGTHLPTAVKFSRMSTRVLVMHWGQSLFGGRAGFVVGQIAPDDYFNSYQLIHPFFNFYGYGSSVSPAANWPNPGFGVGAGVKVTDRFYVQALLGEAGGYRLDDEVFLHFGDNFFKGQFFTAVEVGWTPLSWSERFVNRVALTAMHSDSYEQSPDENYAIALAANWTFGRWVPFLLAGVGNGKGENVAAKGALTVGVGHNFRSHDVFGGSINWIQPPGGLRDQYTLETYYRFYVSARMAMTPDLQVVLNPALDPSRDVLVLFGARLRVDL